MDLLGERYDLYNGNIGHMVNTITDPSDHSAVALGNAYTYDQLHRINSSRTYTNLNSGSNTWGSGSTYQGKYENTFAYDASGNIEKQWRKDENGNAIDSLTYRYEEGSYGRKRNRLYHVRDAVLPGDYDDDIDNMGAYTSSDPNNPASNNNYRYDELGQLVYDAQEEIGVIDWRNDGKIRSITRIGSSPEPDLEFSYDPSGNRLSKKVFGATVQLLYTNYYLRDAQGNVMATYKHRISTENENAMITVDERNIYGSDRLGIYAYPDTVYPVPGLSQSAVQTIPTGYRRYELKNHLGNVTTVLTSHKTPLDANSDGSIDGYQAQVVSSYDYSPFGVTRLSYDNNTGGTVEGNPIAPDYRWCMDQNGIEANGTGNNAVFYGTISDIQNRTGDGNKALSSNGAAGNYMEIVDNAGFDFGANDFTVGIWVRKEAAPTATVNVIAVGKWTNISTMSSNEWCLNIASPAAISTPSGPIRPAQFQIVIGSTLYTAQGTSTLSSTNTWHHLVGVREGSNIKFYLNGSLVATTFVGAGAVNNVTGRNIRIGRSQGALRTKAGFDELVIYQHALSATEISDLYNATCPDLESEPIEIVQEDYRYGFNGKEKDDEIKGAGNSIDYGFRVHDPRLGRFLSIDPLTKTYPWYTPYQYAGNSPIAFIDLDGLERVLAITFDGDVNYRADMLELINAEEISKKTLTTDPGSQLAQAFIDASNADENGIGFVAIWGHGTADMQWGTASSADMYQDDLAALETAIGNGDVNFTDNAIIYLGNCNAGTCDADGNSFAQRIADMTGVKVVAGEGSVGMSEAQRKVEGEKMEYSMYNTRTMDFKMFQQGKDPVALGGTMSVPSLLERGTSMPMERMSSRDATSISTSSEERTIQQ